MMDDEKIYIKGARVNNLKNISVAIPRNRLVVITGLSGSGKSSLAFDTLYAEGQRRYVESLSSYARQFMGRMVKPEVDYIHGIAPAVAIEQKVNTSNPRSTVGTSTEIYEYLKLLFARIGHTFSPISGLEVKRHSVSDVVDFIFSLDEGVRLMLLAPISPMPDRPLRDQLEMLLQEGYVRMMVRDEVVKIEAFLASTDDKTIAHLDMVDIVVDRFAVHHDDDDQRSRVAESVQSTFFEGRGCCQVLVLSEPVQRHSFSNRFEADGITFEKPNANFFSFNNPYGACPTCQGYGSVVGIDENVVIPNQNLSVFDDAVVCWRGDKMMEWKHLCLRLASRLNLPIHTSYCDLSQSQKDVLWHGSGDWPGIDGFFKWVESQNYKIQYRVMMNRYRGKTLCPDCHGSRLRKDAAFVRVAGKNIVELTQMPVADLYEWVCHLDLPDNERAVADRLLHELCCRTRYLIEVGLGYLTLDRLSNTLSGGESQRINLATSLGSSLVGSMYILDEPSIGLHPRDTQRLIAVLRQLRDLGNTVIVVEHDEEIIRSADWLIDIGPGAGRLGGEVVYEGPLSDIATFDVARSLTVDYIAGRRCIAVPESRRPWRDKITVRGAYLNNLKHIDVDFPLNTLTVVSGVSGSGKTSLVKGVLYDVLQKRIEMGCRDYVGLCAAVEGDISRISGVELVDQNPIGRSSRSNPATYMKAYDEIRTLFAQQPLARTRGYKPGYFSFNTEGGRCDNCDGEGYVTVSMQFMADVHLLCDECHGSRFKEETLEVLYRGKNISQVLDMTVDQAIDFFSAPDTPTNLDMAVPPVEGLSPKPATAKIQNRQIVNRLQPLHDVGLGYLKLGQSSSSLSGGEAQRVKLASFLVKGDNERPKLFIFDEPSTGLHFHDIQKLLISFNSLLQRGHSIIVIEHHTDIIKCADWVIDIGPEGGHAGGSVVFAGTPEALASCPQSYTAKFVQ